jgi:hypothetical protein
VGGAVGGAVQGGQTPQANSGDLVNSFTPSTSFGTNGYNNKIMKKQWMQTPLL